MVEALSVVIEVVSFQAFPFGLGDVADGEQRAAILSLALLHPAPSDTAGIVPLASALDEVRSSPPACP